MVPVAMFFTAIEAKFMIEISVARAQAYNENSLAQRRNRIGNLYTLTLSYTVMKLIENISVARNSTSNADAMTILK